LIGSVPAFFQFPKHHKKPPFQLYFHLTFYINSALFAIGHYKLIKVISFFGKICYYIYIISFGADDMENSTLVFCGSSEDFLAKELAAQSNAENGGIAFANRAL
jgi:hypothetical protein